MPWGKYPIITLLLLWQMDLVMCDWMHWPGGAFEGRLGTARASEWCFCIEWCWCFWQSCCRMRTFTTLWPPSTSPLYTGQTALRLAMSHLEGAGPPFHQLHPNWSRWGLCRLFGGSDHIWTGLLIDVYGTRGVALCSFNTWSFYFYWLLSAQTMLKSF